MSRANQPMVIRKSRIHIIFKGIITLTLIAICWCIWTVYSIMYAKPTIRVDYGQQITDLVASHQPQGEDAWQDFNEAFTIFNEVSKEMVDEASIKEDELLAEQTCEVPNFPDDDNQNKLANDVSYWHLYRDYSRIYNGPYDPDRYKIELEEVRRLQEYGAFEAIHRAASKPRMVAPLGETDPEWGDLLMSSTLSIQGSFHEFAQAMTCQMRISFVEDDLNAHGRKLDDVLTSIQHIASQAIPIYYTIAARSASYPLQELRHELMEGGFDPDHCRLLLSILDKRTRWYSTFDLAIQVDRLMSLDAIQGLYTDGWFGGGHVILTKTPDASSSSIPGVTMLSPLEKPTLADRLLNLRALAMPGRSDTTNAINQWYDARIDFSKLQPAIQHKHSASIEALADQLVSEIAVLGMMLADYSSIDDTLRVERTRIEATRIMLGLDWYRGTYDSYPESLDALVPGFFDEMPVDPTNGLSFGYKRFEDPTIDDPEQHRPYLIYSFGLDGVDNDGCMLAGGKRGREAMRSEWPLTGGFEDGHIGYDYVINQVRPVCVER